MSGHTAEEFREFHRFLTEKVDAQATDLSPEEALDEWRRTNPPADAADEDVTAAREALEDMAKGDRGMPFHQFDPKFRLRES